MASTLVGNCFASCAFAGDRPNQNTQPSRSSRRHPATVFVLFERGACLAMVILPHFLFYYSHKSKALEVPAAFVFCSCDSPRGPDPFPMKKPKLPQPFCSENMRPVHHEIPHAEVARLGCQSIRKRPGQSLALTCSTQTRRLDIRARSPAVLHRKVSL